MGISYEDALDCFRSDDLIGLGMEADAVRRRMHPEGVVSYGMDGTIDLTGLAALGAGEGHAACDAICELAGDTIERGGTGVLLEAGGALTMAMERIERIEEIEWFERLFRGVKRRVPAICLLGLSAPEVMAIANVAGIGLGETIARLRDAGLDSLPGDGADLFTGRGQSAEGRCSTEDWVEVHRTAHLLGMRTAAAMVFGGGETMEQRVDFMLTVRRLQEETGGFTAFVPVSFEPGADGGRHLDGVTAVERLKALAISRMVLDNIENLQSTWTGQGLKVLQTGLRFGGNDVGPVGAGEGGSEADVRRMIRDAGFQPVQRDTLYRTMFLN